MKNIVFITEELSAQMMLRHVTKKILPDDVDPHFISFEGKSDLEKNVERKIKGWQKPGSTLFVILRDQDSADCYLVKKELMQKASQAKREPATLIRIACHELESFYLGDLDAVERGLNVQNIASKQENHKFRNPDKLNNAKQELQDLTEQMYQPLKGSRTIAPYLAVDGSNRSHSFNALINGVKNITQSA